MRIEHEMVANPDVEGYVFIGLIAALQGIGLAVLRMRFS
jgi:hypothetical protein